jgi:hypothetical protein
LGKGDCFTVKDGAEGMIQASHFGQDDQGIFANRGPCWA